MAIINVTNFFFKEVENHPGLTVRRDPMLEIESQHFFTNLVSHRSFYNTPGKYDIIGDLILELKYVFRHRLGDVTIYVKDCYLEERSIGMKTELDLSLRILVLEQGINLLGDKVDFIFRNNYLDDMADN